MSLCVDDLVYMGICSKMKNEFKVAMMNEFEMKDSGIMKYFLGKKVYQGKDEIFICQEKYAKDMSKKFDMADCKPLSTPIAHGVAFCIMIVLKLLIRHHTGALWGVFNSHKA